MKSIQKVFLPALVAIMFFSCTKEPLTSLVPKTVDQDLSLPSISVNGALLHSEAFGHPDSTMIVVIHGGPGGDYREVLNCRELAEHGYKIVFYDQRGSGLSQRFDADFYASLGAGAIDMMYDDLTGVIAHYRTNPNQKVFLLGKSWGAMLASGYVGKYPNAINGLVVIEPGGLKWEDVKEYVRKSQSFNIWSEAINDVTYLDQFLTGKENQHEILDYKLAMSALHNDITGENAGVDGFWRYGAVLNASLFKMGDDHQPDFAEGIYQFNTPVLFIYSDGNKAYGESWAQKISSAYSTKELFKVTGTGHNGIVSDDAVWTQQTLPEILNHFNSL
jgi:proline iminopeptidase